ncbi:hypothetical protein D5R81_18875 [Parashewanella spongiae]|uniref:DUF3015 domain-containing protein n=1 Tax=Parashewanella spongiae TaxID=342950 RepID=A0A3A6TX67_9GAMM|nr:hypothetical protein [Parashewanella spongiae]MCL1080083.1 hypothetical protein [Parashewanella spongiae]RJY04942.1 hypothetical protein D5R81_18875 [Parashewanella spongiae]
MRTIKLALFALSIICQPSQASSTPCGEGAFIEVSSSQGTWHSQVQHLNGGHGNVMNVDDNCSAINGSNGNSKHFPQLVFSFVVSAGQPTMLNHVADEQASSKSAILVSMVQQRQPDQMYSYAPKACLFYIPNEQHLYTQVQTVSLNNAECFYFFDALDVNPVHKLKAK